MEKPIITIGLPLYNMNKIYWLALESINRQETDIPFEIIICAEDGHFNKDDIHIDNKSCVSIRLMRANVKMPLSFKWYDMLGDANGTIFMLQGGDDYSDKYRVNRAYEDIIKQKHDWTQDIDGWGYHLQKKKLLKFDQKSYQRGINISFRTSLKTRLKKEDVRSGVDYWLWSKMYPNNPKWNRNLNKSVFTHGANIISQGRGKFFENTAPPFYDTDKNIKDFIPDDIVEKLNLTF